MNTLVVHKPVFKKSHSITFVKIQSLILVACLSPHSSLMIKSCWQIKKPNKVLKYQGLYKYNEDWKKINTGSCIRCSQFFFAI